ncbi:hypothetical protein Fcan01_16897 [Folsomia candida]|uniref:Uncharacterized protein n=1 Tax=Folsomia candida TaxID=158441 RepID=A0A226DQE7_FOLCA|nr:hypothetical protein Fcan01_16897 [Folsomia candida]
MEDIKIEPITPPQSPMTPRSPDHFDDEGDRPPTPIIPLEPQPGPSRELLAPRNLLRDKYQIFMHRGEQESQQQAGEEQPGVQLMGEEHFDELEDEDDVFVAQPQGPPEQPTHLVRNPKNPNFWTMGEVVRVKEFELKIARSNRSNEFMLVMRQNLVFQPSYPIITITPYEMLELRLMLRAAIRKINKDPTTVLNAQKKLKRVHNLKRTKRFWTSSLVQRSESG